MYCVQPVTPEILYVGGSDRRLTLFENTYPLSRGVSYNAYLVLDEKTVLMDTVDWAIGERFFENLTHALQGRTLDYVVVNHMEPDHAATLGELLRRYPDVQVVGTAKTMAMIGQFFGMDLAGRGITVKEGETLTTGRHTFTFYMAPMVHWPEVMVTYDNTEKVLFCADAFGTFGALNGNLFADEVDFPRDWLAEARRYYANIVGKYGAQVQALLKKAAGLEIAVLCPLHGPIWRKDIGWFVDKYQTWSTYMPEEQGVMIACASIYGHTEQAAEVVANRLAQHGVRNIALYDLSHHHVSEMVSEAFRWSHLVLASATYNNGLFTPMENLLLDLKAHNFQNRTVALMENGSWAPQAGKLMREAVDGMKNMRILEPSITIKSASGEDQRPALEALADAIIADLKG